MIPAREIRKVAYSMKSVSLQASRGTTPDQRGPAAAGDSTYAPVLVSQRGAAQSQ